MTLPMSVLIITRNEESALPECLRSVNDFDDVFVIDSESQDKTADLAREAGAQVVPFSWDGRYPKKKQWALNNAPTRHDWVLLLDADERATPALSKELGRLLSNERALSDVGAIDIPLLYEWQGRRLRFGHRVVKRAVVHRRRCAFPVVEDLGVSNMWEVEGHYQPQTAWRVLRARSRLAHSDPDPLHQWFARHNRYSDWEAHLRAAALADDVARTRSRQGRIFGFIPGKPAAFFAYSYLVRAGILDGRAGLDYAIANAFYYWQVDVKTRERRRLGDCMQV